MFAATSLKTSRREVSIGAAEHSSLLKNNQIKYPRFSFTPKTGKELPKTGVLFLLCKFGWKNDKAVF